MNQRTFFIIPMLLILLAVGCANPNHVTPSTSTPMATQTPTDSPSPVPSPTPTVQIFPDLTQLGLIIFTGENGKPWQVNPDGTDAHATDIILRNWSPSKQFYLDFGDALYIRSSVGNGEFRIGLESLGSITGINHAVWSPDGEWIAIMDRDLDLHVINFDGTGHRKLTNNNKQTFSLCDKPPLWSPDGKWLAYLCFSDHWVLNLQPVKGDGQRRALTLTGWLNSFCWSPDSTLVIFGGEHNLELINNTLPIAGIYSFSAINGDVRTIWTGEAFDLTSSPDGRLIAFSGLMSGSHKIAVLDPISGQVKAISDTKAEDSHPSWSPDGNYIAFDSTTGRSGLFVVRLSNRTSRQILTFGTYPTWLFVPGIP